MIAVDQFCFLQNIGNSLFKIAEVSAPFIWPHSFKDHCIRALDTLALALPYESPESVFTPIRIFLGAVHATAALATPARIDAAGALTAVTALALAVPTTPRPDAAAPPAPPTGCTIPLPSTRDDQRL